MTHGSQEHDSTQAQYWVPDLSVDGTIQLEKLDEAIERIGWLYDRPTAYRRP